MTKNMASGHIAFVTKKKNVYLPVSPGCSAASSCSSVSGLVHHPRRLPDHPVRPDHPDHPGANVIKLFYLSMTV